MRYVITHETAGFFCDGLARTCSNTPRATQGAEPLSDCGNGRDDDCDGYADGLDTDCGGCAVDAQCGDGDACTADTCTASGCEHAPLGDAAPCDDGDDCTVGDTCSSGLCIGAPLDADGDGDAPLACLGLDCDDADELIAPDADESSAAACADTIDDDCDGLVDEYEPECEPPVCSSTGWCWSHAAPHGMSFSGAYASSPSDVWLVASGGAIVRFDGARYTMVPTPTPRALSGVFGASPSALFAVGHGGTVLTSNGSAWSLVPAAEIPTTNDLFAVHGASANEVFAVGEQGTILYFDGATWTLEPSGTSERLNAVAALGGGEAFAVGDDGWVAYRSAGAWTVSRVGTIDLHVVHRFDDGAVWTISHSGVIWSWSGGSWVRTDLPYLDARSIAGSTSSDVWIGGHTYGSVAHFDGTSFDVRDTLTGTDAVMALVRAGDDVIAFGDHGETWLRRDGGWHASFEAVASNGERPVQAAWARTDDDVWVVGSAGLVMRWNGHRWAEHIIDGEPTLTGVWGSGAANVWMSGYSDENGFVFHWDGTSFTAAMPRSTKVGSSGSPRRTPATHAACRAATWSSSRTEGFAASLPEAALHGILNNPHVAFVEQDQLVSADGVTSPQGSATWGLDRVDQADRPLDGQYQFSRSGAGVHAFELDTGIRPDHVEFTGRLLLGFDAIGDGYGTNDCHGHGTHVAGTLGGPTYGVAKEVSLTPVRVLDCTASGAWSGVIAGLDFVASSALRPAVANLSLGGPVAEAVDAAVAGAIAKGVVVVVAAGNSNSDACSASPARVPSAITVAASTSIDYRASFSSWGSCVDLFAPGGGVTSASNASPTATTVMSGTSMPSPHVAGVAALALSMQPSASPASIAEQILSSATAGRLAAASIGPGSPSLLLYSLLQPSSTPPSEPAPEPEPTPEPAVTIVAFQSMVGSAMVSRKSWRAAVVVTVREVASGAMIANATVTGAFLPGSTVRCITGSRGICTLASGSMKSTVQSVTFSGRDTAGTMMSYDASQNA